MTTADHPANELVVVADGSIPADPVERLGLRPGAHLRVVDAGQPVEPRGIAASLPQFPDLEWAGFARGGELARNDLSGT